MDPLSEEEVAARLAYLQDQKALAKVAAESAKQEMKFNEEMENLRRQQKERHTLPAIIDLSSPQKLVKVEAPRSPGHEIFHNNDDHESIQFDTPNVTPAGPGPDQRVPSTVAPRNPMMSLNHLLNIDSDLPRPQIIQPKPESKKRKIVEDEEFRTITRALEGDDLVELRCDLCNGNCGKYSKILICFRSVPGFRTHIQNSHPSSLPASGKLTAREIVQRCTYRTLSDEEKQAVMSHDHAAFKVDKILARGADAGAPIHAPRGPRKKRSRPSQEESSTLEDIVIPSCSTFTPIVGTDNPPSAATNNQDDDGVEIQLEQHSKMKTRGAEKRKRAKHHME
ncbi:unnamed protein product [Zymoseptoria tritici ST99CH_3D7]|uniref:Uncharacterized protein n=1 Tax=Zymoseptoria tritici (strain ST99CH_3D7) TaxID=1276538 RepID=A0A1X7RW81_ZYMT9|nr:unnamed protein product [Zymoseptoria tritici ST99CH_3D7]